MICTQTWRAGFYFNPGFCLSDDLRSDIRAAAEVQQEADDRKWRGGESGVTACLLWISQTVRPRPGHHPGSVLAPPHLFRLCSRSEPPLCLHILHSINSSTSCRCPISFSLSLKHPLNPVEKLHPLSTRSIASDSSVLFSHQRKLERSFLLASHDDTSFAGWSLISMWNILCFKPEMRFLQVEKINVYSIFYMLLVPAALWSYMTHTLCEIFKRRTLFSWLHRCIKCSDHFIS